MKQRDWFAWLLVLGLGVLVLITQHAESFQSTTVAETVSAQGTAAAPAAGATIASIAAGSLPRGRYHVRVRVEYETAAGAANDYDVAAGATQKAVLSIPALVTAGNYGAWEGYLDLDGSTAINVRAVAGGVMGSTYVAQVSATRVRQ